MSRVSDSSDSVLSEGEARQKQVLATLVKLWLTSERIRSPDLQESDARVKEFKAKAAAMSIEDQVSEVQGLQIKLQSRERSQVVYPPISPDCALEGLKNGTASKTAITVNEVKGYEGRIWEFKNMMSKEECQDVVRASEKQLYDIAESYCFMYRNRFNDRFQCDDDVLANLLWDRVKDVIPQEKRDRSGRMWKPSHLNRRFRFCKYNKGHYFGPHVDGGYRASEKLRSFLTFMIYLNDQGTDFKGGSTCFLASKRGAFRGEYMSTAYEVKPKAGTGVFFWQYENDLLHEGTKLKSGTKYIMRTDVMYVPAD